MFGYLRFILAILVVLSHLGITFYGLNPGVIAVVIFYILAGYVVSYLYTNIIPNKKYKIILFYKDRIKRIFPLYIYILILTIIFLLTTSFGEPNFTTMKIFNNLTIIPLNFYMLLDNNILTSPSWWLIPPAWSLGTELQAYLLLPFALLYQRFKYITATISFLIYIAANFSIIHPDYFGYRLIIGVFFIFLLGTSLQKVASNTQTRFDKPFLFTIWIATFLLISLSLYLNMSSPTYTKETALGLIVGLPLIYSLSQVKIKLPLNSLLGSLSYGLFLSHFLSIWVVQYWSLAPIGSLFHMVIIIILSLFITHIALSYIEKKLKKCRKYVD